MGITSTYNNLEKGYKFYVYRFIDIDNKISYVGSTISLRSRISLHFSRKDGDISKFTGRTKRVEYIELDKVADGIIKEIYYINKYQPYFNEQHKFKDGVGLSLDTSQDVWKELNICCVKTF